MNDTRFESCIKCTVCTTACPVSRVNPRYPGPKQAGPDGEPSASERWRAVRRCAEILY